MLIFAVRHQGPFPSRRRHYVNVLNHFEHFAPAHIIIAYRFVWSSWIYLAEIARELFCVERTFSCVASIFIHAFTFFFFCPFLALFCQILKYTHEEMCNRNTSCFTKRKKYHRSRKTWTIPLHLRGVDIPSQTASHELLPSFQMCHLSPSKRADVRGPKSIGKLIGPKQSYVTSHYCPDVTNF